MNLILVKNLFISWNTYLQIWKRIPIIRKNNFNKRKINKITEYLCRKSTNFKKKYMRILFKKN